MQRPVPEEGSQPKEQLNELIINNLTEGIIIYDVFGKIIFVNETIEKVLGIKKEQLLGKRFDDPHFKVMTLTGEEIPVGKRPFAEVLKTGRPVLNKEFVVKVFDSPKIIVSVNIIPVKTKGRIINFIVSYTDITEQKQSEILLRESEERYRLLIRQSPDAIVVYSDGKVDFVNDAGVQMMEAGGPEDLIGKPVMDFVHPDYRQLVIKRMTEMIKEGKSVPPIEEKFIKLNGEVIDVEVAASPVTYENKNAIQVVFRDITDRKRVQEELTFKSTLIDSEIDSVFVVDLKGNIIYLNEAAYKSRGYKREELLGKKISNINVPKDKALLTKRLKLLQEKGELTFESTQIKKDKSLMNIEVHARVIEYLGKKVVVSINRDITERKKVERRLKESEERFRSVVETATDSIVQCQNGLVLYWNKAAENLFGYQKDKILNKPVTTFMAKDEIQKHLEAVENYIKTGESKIIGKKPYEIEGASKEGEIIPLELSLAEGKNKNGSYFTAIFRDLRERKQAEKELKEAYEKANRIADTLQKSLLPAKIPPIKGLEIKYFYQPAEGSEVGGDFYDIFETTNSKFGILIGDVSGKGVEVATETSRVKYLMRDKAVDGSPPDQAIRLLNNALFKQNIEHFTALTYCLYDAESSALQVTNAGNPYPYDIKNDNFIRIIGTPVSLIQNQEYPLVQHTLQKGDIIMFYTDGLVEVRKDGDLFGKSRVRDFIKRNPDLNLSELIENLVEEAKNFSENSLRDDILIVGLRKK